MSKKELKKLIEAGFIPGIYNFCDRWCEKCTQRPNCLSYAMGKKMEEKVGHKLEGGVLRKNENMWVYLKNIFDSTYEILQELARERGIDMEDIYASESRDRGLWIDEYDAAQVNPDIQSVENTDIMRICLIYEEMADLCLEKVFGILDEKDWEEGCFEDQETGDALDAVNWYMDIIHSKARRALFGCRMNVYMKDRIIGEEDYNGSAKVVLISIEHSQEAWNVLKKYCSVLSREIVHIKAVLTQLKRDIEYSFPAARQFVRPGFDN